MPTGDGGESLVEQRDAAVVSDRRQRRDNSVPGRYLGENPVRQFRLLKHPDVHVGLNRPS